MIGRGAPCSPARPRNGTTARPAGWERRMRATRSHAEPRTPRRRLLGAVRAHDEGRRTSLWSRRHTHRREIVPPCPGRIHDDGGAVTMNAGGLTINAGERTMTTAERDRTPNHATRSRAPSPEPPRRPHRSVRAHEDGGASDYGRGAHHYDRGAVTMTAAPVTMTAGAVHMNAGARGHT